MTPASHHATGHPRTALVRCLAAVLVAIPLALPAQAAGVADTLPIPLAFSVPESPAFTFLGVSPTKVTRASNARDLGAALVNAVDSAGRAVTGVAIGATLWTLLPDVTVDLTSYQTRTSAYALANTHLSIGTARSTGDSADTDVALGVRTTLYDGSDPMRSPEFVRSLTAALTRCVDMVGPPPIDPAAVTGVISITADADDPVLQCVEAANDTLRLRWFHNSWNRPALSWGAGAGWRMPGSEADRLIPVGLSTWLAGAYPMGRSGQLLAQLQYDHRRALDTLGRTNLLTYGVRAIRGSRGQNLFVELAGIRHLSALPGVRRSNVQWSGGVELQIASSYWLSAGFGRRDAAQDEPERVALFASMRWGIASRSRLRMLPAYAPAGS